MKASWTMAVIVAGISLSTTTAFSPASSLPCLARQRLVTKSGRSTPVLAPRMGLFDNLFGGGNKNEEELYGSRDPLLDRNFRPAARQDGKWEEYADDNGQKYFYNTATKETLWEAEYIERTRQMEEKVAKQQPASVGAPAASAYQQQNQGFLPAWMRNQAAAANAPAAGPFVPGNAMDATRFKVAWRQGGGTMMQSGGFGYVFFGTYDATPNPQARPLSLNVCIKLPNTDPDSIMAHSFETQVNQLVGRDGGIPGVADYIGTVDLSPIQAQLPPGIGSMQGIVWRTVQGRTLDNFFDRGGGMSPVLANTLKVTDSSPTKIKGGVVYIKTSLCRNILGRTLMPVAALHEKGIIHRDLKPRNIMLAEKDPLNPLCIIDFGSAIDSGRQPFMNDYTQVYAPPEAPIPDRGIPGSYDIFTLGIVGLRVLMPSLIAGENGIATLGKVAVVEIPGFDYDLKDNASQFEFKALNSECAALLNQPELLELLGKMLSKNPADRPTAEQCLTMLGPEWQQEYRTYKEGRQPRGNCGSCGKPVFTSDKGRFRNAQGTYFHETCAQMYQ